MPTTNKCCISNRVVRGFLLDSGSSVAPFQVCDYSVQIPLLNSSYSLTEIITTAGTATMAIPVTAFDAQELITAMAAIGCSVQDADFDFQDGGISQLIIYGSSCVITDATFDNGIDPISVSVSQTDCRMSNEANPIMDEDGVIIQDEDNLTLEIE